MQDLRSRIAVAMTRSPKTSPQSAEALKTTPDDFQDPGTRAAVRARRCKPGHPAVQQHSPRRAGGRPVTRRLYLSATCSEPLSMVFLSRDLVLRLGLAYSRSTSSDRPRVRRFGIVSEE